MSSFRSSFLCLLGLWLAEGGWSEPLQLKASPPELECAMGSRPTFRLEIENRTPQTVSFSYWVPLFCYPLFDSGIPPIQAQVYNGPAQPVTVSLRPGEKHELSSSPFRLVVHAQAGPEAQWPATAGLYSAQFQVDLRGAKGQPWRLRSNRVNLRVTP